MRWIDMGSVLERGASRYAERPMLSDAFGDLTYAEAYDRACELAGSLIGSGVGHGDRVVTAMRNRREYVLLLFACALAQIVACPVNRRYSGAELAHAVAETGARAVVLDASIVGEVPHLAEADLLRIVVGDGATAPGAGWVPLDALPKGELARESPPNDDDVHSIHYTSGSTSQPKGVIRSYGANASVAMGSLEKHPVRPGDTWLLSLPMHSAGIYSSMLSAVMAGGRIVVADFDAGSLGPLVERERITHASLGPTMWFAARRSLATSDLTSLRHVMWGGMQVQESMIRTLAELLPVPPVSGYGMTESTSMCYSSPEIFRAGKVLACGYPVSTMDVRVVSPAGEECAAGEPGEVVARGASLFTGYLNRPAETSATLREGWLFTGDRGTKDAEGVLTVGGRINGVIISGNENVYPEEVESVIASIPGVEQVAVAGVPSDRWGNEVCAYVVGAELRPDLVREHCARHLTRFKVPKRVFLLDDLPKDAQGKVRRSELVAQTPRAGE